MRKRTTSRYMHSKVPEITPWFWATKIIMTVAGATDKDLHPELGYKVENLRDANKETRFWLVRRALWAVTHAAKHRDDAGHRVGAAGRCRDRDHARRTPRARPPGCCRGGLA